MSAPGIELHFGADGVIRCIYDDSAPDLLDGLGSFETRRASRVEPEAGGWSADMTPFGGEDAPILGPFPRRGAALAAEVQWLASELERRSA